MHNIIILYIIFNSNNTDHIHIYIYSNILSLTADRPPTFVLIKNFTN